jgi:hypothetical protein
MVPKTNTQTHTEIDLWKRMYQTDIHWDGTKVEQIYILVAKQTT